MDEGDAAVLAFAAFFAGAVLMTPTGRKLATVALQALRESKKGG